MPRIDSFVCRHPCLYFARLRALELAKRAVYPLLGIDLGMTERAFGEVLSLCLENKVRTLLEVGCGTGDYLKSRSALHGFRCVGLDVSWNMVCLGAANQPALPLVHGKSAHLPFPDSSVDIVLFRWLFHHLPRPEWHPTLSEGLRVARRFVLVVDVCPPRRAIGRLLARLYLAITDGGQVYLSREAWRDFLGATRRLQERKGAGLNVIWSCAPPLTAPGPEREGWL